MRIALVLIAAATVSLGGCGTFLPSMHRTKDFAKLAPPRPLPKPEVRTKGRTVMVRLPYRARDGRSWTAVAQPADVGPFAFKDLKAQPQIGPGRTDLAVFTYVAGGPGSGTFKFDLEPYGRGANDLPPAAHYETTVNVR